MLGANPGDSLYTPNVWSRLLNYGDCIRELISFRLPLDALILRLCGTFNFILTTERFVIASQRIQSDVRIRVD